ncbi:response regulator transcription factor [Sulfitobacter sp. LCG007]
MTIRLLIIDDDPEITSALVRGLSLHGYEAEAENRADRALDRLSGDGFAGAIVDVMLGADNGIELVRTARQRGATLPILMLSALSDVEERVAGLEAGANDYIVKPFSFDELVARLQVQELRSRKDMAEPAVLDLSRKCLTLAGERAELTDREIDLLALLSKNAGEPLSRGAIFDALWATEGSTSENVVDVYIGYLRKKLAGVDFGFEIKTIRNKGFMLEGRPPRLSGH